MLQLNFDLKKEFELYSGKDELNINLSSSIFGIPVIGNIFRYSLIHSKLITAIENKAEAILFNIHSHGGTITNLVNCLNFIETVNQKIPIYTFIHNAYSSAFILALSGKKVYASSTSMMGGLGVQIIQRSTEDHDNTSTITSKNATNKNSDGPEILQEMADATELVLIEKIKKYRSIDSDDFVTNWRNGGIFGAGYALSYNAIDHICEYDQCLNLIHTELNLDPLGVYDLLQVRNNKPLKNTESSKNKIQKNQNTEASASQTDKIELIDIKNDNQLPDINFEQQRKQLVQSANQDFKIDWREI